MVVTWWIVAFLRSVLQYTYHNHIVVHRYSLTIPLDKNVFSQSHTGSSAFSRSHTGSSAQQKSIVAQITYVIFVALIINI